MSVISEVHKMVDMDDDLNKIKLESHATNQFLLGQLCEVGLLGHDRLDEPYSTAYGTLGQG